MLRQSNPGDDIPDDVIDNMSAQMAEVTLALFDSLGVEPPANPTAETIKAFLDLMEQSDKVNVINN